MDLEETHFTCVKALVCAHKNQQRISEDMERLTWPDINMGRILGGCWSCDEAPHNFETSGSLRANPRHVIMHKIRDTVLMSSCIAMMVFHN